MEAQLDLGQAMQKNPASMTSPASAIVDSWLAWLDQVERVLSHPVVSLAPQRLWQSVLPGWIFAQTVNITNQNSSSPETERAILAQQSYGRQLGKVIDAVDVLIKARTSNIDEKDQELLDQLHKLRHGIDAIKDEIKKAKR